MNFGANSTARYVTIVFMLCKIAQAIARLCFEHLNKQAPSYKKIYAFRTFAVTPGG